MLRPAFREEFERHDPDRTGAVSRRDFSAALKAVGFDLTGQVRGHFNPRDEADWTEREDGEGEIRERGRGGRGGRAGRGDGGDSDSEDEIRAQGESGDDDGSGGRRGKGGKKKKKRGGQFSALDDEFEQDKAKFKERRRDADAATAAVVATVPADGNTPFNVHAADDRSHAAALKLQSRYRGHAVRRGDDDGGGARGGRGGGGGGSTPSQAQRAMKREQLALVEAEEMFRAAIRAQGGDQRRGLDLRVVFEDMDADGNGYLTDAEVGRILQDQGVVLTDTVLRTLCRHFDKDGDGRIDYKEFAKFAKYVPNDLGAGLEQLRTAVGAVTPAEAFAVIDRDGNGRITRREFALGVAKLGVELSASEMRGKRRGKSEEGEERDHCKVLSSKFGEHCKF